MKKLLLLLLLLLSSAVQAQTSAEGMATERKFYAGIGLTNTSYHIYYKELKSSGHAHTGYFGPVFLNFGYRLNNKARLQAGLAYGGSKSREDWIAQPMDSVAYHYYSRTRVIALSLTMQHVLFQAFRRFPVYGTATLMPAYGMSKSKTEEIRDTGTTTYWVRDSGMNVFATAGIGFNYKISNRFEGYVEVLPFKYNLNGRNSRDRDWEQYASKSRQLYKSLGFGFNYSL